MAETKFGRRLPLSVLIEHNTIRSLASLIDQQRTPALLVPINPSGSRPILFAAPGGGGDSLYFRNLARYLPPDQPFYGIQLNDDPEWRKQFPSIEMIAQLFIAEISAIQPHGPYFFAGHSFGGYVVLEIARHFRAAGEEIGLLAFWDTHPPGPRQQAPFFDRILIHVHNIRDLPPRQRLSYLLGRLEMINLRLTRHPLWRRFLRKQGFLPKNTLNTSQIAKFSFDPQPFPGDGVLFKARERHWYVRWDPMSRWTRYITGKLEVISVPGDHNTLMFEPHVAHLAAAMLPVLEQAQKRSVHSLS
jgi:thioesterase domain-containing protein